MANLNTTRITAKDLPSFESMGFDKLFKKRFPYSPAIDIIREHYEQLWAKHAEWTLIKRTPDSEQLEKRMWRTKIVYWLRKQMKRLEREMPKYIPEEEDFFATDEDGPALKARWKLYRAKMILLRAKRNRFATKKVVLTKQLQFEWLKVKKYDFMIREMRGRRGVHRKQFVVRHANILLWCQHWKCWQIRIKSVPYLLYWYLKFIIYYKRHH